MTKLEKLYSIIENSRDVGVKLPKGVLQQVEELEEGIIKEGGFLYDRYLVRVIPHRQNRFTTASTALSLLNRRSTATKPPL